MTFRVTDAVNSLLRLKRECVGSYVARINCLIGRVSAQAKTILSRRDAGALIAAAPGAPQHPGVGAARQIVGHHAAGDGANDYLQIRIGVDVGDRRRAQAAVPVVACEGAGRFTA